MSLADIAGPVTALGAFVAATREQDTGGAAFVCVSPQTLRIDVDGGVWLMPGAVVAHRGGLTFERVPTLGARAVKDAALREAAPIVRARGAGQLYCAAHGGRMQVVRLAGESLVVAWRNLVAFEDSVRFEPSLAAHGVGLAAGGLMVATLSGHGLVAFSAHGRPLTLDVSREAPVTTEMHATIAWSPSVTPVLESNLTWRTALAHGGQPPFQMRFEGTGFVVVQPSRDLLHGPAASRLLKGLMKLFKP